MPDEISLFDIEHVILGFVETAKGAVAAGFDGVEIHGAHGYLISEFLSSYANKRADDYGGTVENRFRFARRIIEAVRAVVPDDKLLSFRISNWGGADIGASFFESKQEWQTIIGYLDTLPIDLISVSTLNYKDKAFGTDKNMAQLTRGATQKPIAVCGGIFDRATADDAVADADIILSAKSLLLNPDWVKDIRENKILPERTRDESTIAYTDTPLP